MNTTIIHTYKIIHNTTQCHVWLKGLIFPFKLVPSWTLFETLQHLQGTKGACTSISSESAVCFGSESSDKLCPISCWHRSQASPGECKLGWFQWHCLGSCSPSRELSPQLCPGTWEQRCPQQVRVGRIGCVSLQSPAFPALNRDKPRGAQERLWQLWTSLCSCCHHTTWRGTDTDPVQQPPPCSRDSTGVAGDRHTQATSNTPTDKALADRSSVT